MAALYKCNNIIGEFVTCVMMTYFEAFAHFQRNHLVTTKEVPYSRKFLQDV